MENSIFLELEKFNNYMSQNILGNMFVHKIDEFGFELSASGVPPSGQYDLTLIALNHGDEVGGIAVLNLLCELISSKKLTPSIRIVLLLGNVAAAEQGKRFIERDINRSFSCRDKLSLESKRAKCIESIVINSRFMLDIHQTIEPTSTPFFVLQFNPLAAIFAHNIHPDHPVITDKENTAEKMGGMRCDEFGYQSNCISLALEIGQKGFSEEAISVGLNASINALKTVENWQVISERNLKKMNSMWTWEHIELYPEEHVQLLPGLKNFDRVFKNQIIGKTESGVHIKIAIDGLLIFPKYINKGDKKPVELYRILAEVHYISEYSVLS